MKIRLTSSSPERSARSPSPEAVRSPSQPLGTQVPDAGQLRDLPELMDELDAVEKNAAELRHILSQGLKGSFSGECAECAG